MGLITTVKIMKTTFIGHRILLKNIDECDTLICYVDNNLSNSGAKSIMKYAEKKGLNVINLFDIEN